MMRKAVLMVNLGTPATPATKDVRRYLREFLGDPRVVDVNPILKRILLETLILPLRSKFASCAYQRVWTPEGSPLLSISRRQCDALQNRVDLPVHLAMRYGEPSLRATIETLKHDGTQRLYLIPLFPQYATCTYETAVVRAMELCREIAPTMRVDTLQPFYDDPAYIDALVASAKPFLGDGFQRLLFSYHGLPERHIRATDPSHAHCLCTRDCCHSPNPAHATCYRHQCLATAELFVRRASLEGSDCAVAFQSRFSTGSSWLSPSTLEVIRRYGAEKTGTLLVVTPGFTTDCLETLDELCILDHRIYHEAGGGEMVVVPCLNDHPLFMDFLAAKVHQWQDSLPENVL